MQTSVLALPAETADTRAATAFEDGNHNRSALHCRWLAVPNGGQCLIRYRLNKSVAQCIGRNAKCTDVVLKGNVLDNVRIRCARLNERTAQRLEEHTVRHTAGAMFCDLARAAGRHVLMAFPATLPVEGRAKAVGDCLYLLEDKAVII